MFLCFDTTSFHFFRIIAHFISSFRFLVKLSHYWQIQLNKNMSEKCTATEKSFCENVTLFRWIVYGLSQSSLAKINGFFFTLPMFVFFKCFTIFFSTFSSFNEYSLIFRWERGDHLPFFLITCYSCSALRCCEIVWSFGFCLYMLLFCSLVT